MSETNWYTIKRDYLFGNKNLKKLAKAHGIPYGTLRNRACSEKWVELKKKEKKELNTKITHEIQKEQVLSEVDVRMKNFESGTTCLDRGLERLSQLKDDEIPPQLAIKMVELGIKSRHASAGLADNFNINNTNLNINLKPGEETFEENQERFQKQSLLAAKFIKHLDAYTKKHGAIDI